MPEVRTIRVLRLITRLNVGGPTRHVALLLELLDPGQFEQHLVSGFADPHEGEGRLVVQGAVRRCPHLVREVRPLSDLRARREIRAIIREIRPDLVHTHQGKAGALGRIEARRAGVQAVVHTYHGHTFDGYFGSLMSGAVRWMERRAARCSNALICQSPSQERDVQQALGPVAVGRTRIIPPAVRVPLSQNPGQDRQLLRNELSIPDTARLVLLPARLAAIKQPELAIDLVMAARKSIDLRLVIAGDGPLMGSLATRVRDEGLEDAVHLLGWREDVSSLLAAADAVLLTSRMEGTPLALLEAMGAGVPVAAPGVGGVADVLGSDGLILDPHDSPAAWSGALLDFLEDPRTADRIARARRRVEVDHAPERLARDVARLYEDLLS